MEVDTPQQALTGSDEYTLILPSEVHSSRPVQSLLGGCDYFVEANYEERMGLHHRYSLSADRCMQNRPDIECKLKFEWQGNASSTSFHIGYIRGDKKIPVGINVTIEEVGGKKVCFYYASTRYADHQMVEDWFDKFFCKKSRHRYLNRSDANGFAAAMMQLTAARNGGTQ
jgi:hypothetical protein